MRRSLWRCAPFPTAALLVMLATSAVAAAVYPPNSALTVTKSPSLPLPGYLAPITDPVFGTRIMRISDQTAFSSTKTVVAHHYAKTQPWNSDGTLIMFGGWPAALLDGKTFALLRWVNPPGEHHTWMNTSPNHIIGVQQPLSIVRLDASTNKTEAIHKFSEFDSVSYGGYEGNLSNDDRYMALSAKKGNAVTALVYDLVANKIASTYDGGSVLPNNTTMSPSGRFFVVQWDVSGGGQRQGITVHDRESGAFLHNIARTGGGHYDVCIDREGKEVIVVSEDASPALQMVRLEDGQTTQLLSRDVMGWNIHVSCRNVARPGWAYVSQFAQDVQNDGPKAFYQTVFAVKLDGSGVVQRFAHEHHSETAEYERSPFAVPSRDGSIVMWRSDWMNAAANAPIYSYVAWTEAPASEPRDAAAGDAKGISPDAAVANERDARAPLDAAAQSAKEDAATQTPRADAAQGKAGDLLATRDAGGASTARGGSGCSFSFSSGKDTPLAVLLASAGLATSLFRRRRPRALRQTTRAGDAVFAVPAANRPAERVER